MPFAAQAAGGSHDWAQIGWGLRYVAQRYGTPLAALSHENVFGWYGKGLDAMFRSPALIGVGERGPERVTVTPAGQGGRGGNVYNNHFAISLPPGSPREHGRQIVEFIRQYEAGSGPGWRK